ncbi:HypC/HybG/HupF family hydrogenase formation chaperone [Geminocystis sp. CENA526]|uniref:HypC/HybG/HupF family hydrogenase formation chaperone n=1 Tax=Geminocystis sp. CENA526 TaxID=1355871 RepID=UPI003D6EE0E3
MCLAIPGKVVTIEGENPFAKKGKVSFGGILKEVSFAYTPDVKIDNYVVVHVGFALNIIDEEEAEKTLTDLVQMGILS